MLPVTDGTLYYETHGSGSPVVLAHGIGGNHAIWFQQLEVLARQHTVVLFDHRGFGNSIDAGGHGRAEFVNDLRALLNHLELDSVSLVGQSMGGGTCLGLACAEPSRVSAFVMCDSLHGFEEPLSVRQLMDEARQATNDLSQLERVLGERCRRDNPELAVLYRQLNSFNAVNRLTLPGKFAPLWSPAAVAATGTPMLFLVGEHDVLFPSAAVRLMHADVAGSEFVEVAGAGHSVFFEQPAEFNARVLEFLSRAHQRRAQATLST